MVAIPGGTFTMGSPENERGSTDDERPQHEVTVQPAAIWTEDYDFFGCGCPT